MTRPAARLALAIVLSACGTSTSPSTPPTAPSPASPSPSPASVSTTGPTPAPVIHDLALYPLLQANDLFRGAKVASIAGGRSGVVVLGTDQATGALLSWTSPDGDGWARHWLPGTTFGGGSPERLIGGDFGYLALGWQLDGPSVRRELWSSTDGIAWRRSDESGLPEGPLAWIASGPSGIVATFERGDAAAPVAVSSDGQSWQVGAFPPGAFPDPRSIVALPVGFLATGSTEGTDAAGGTTGTYAAWRSDDGLVWVPDAALTASIFGRGNSITGWTLSQFGVVAWDNAGGVARVTDSGLGYFPPPPSPYGRLVGSPAGLLWVTGATLDGRCTAAWQYDGKAWVALDNASPDPGCIDSGAPIVLGDAPLAGGAVLYGLSGHDYERVAFLVRDADAAPSGTAAGGPVPAAPAASIPDPLAVTFDHLSTCPSPPTTLDAMLALDPYLAAGCFGPRDLSFRAWVVDPGEGYGGTCGAFVPMWIRECVLPDYLLSAGANAEGELHAMRSPSASGDLAGVGRWVEVTGHYDDPISPSCRFDGNVGTIDFEPELPRALAVLQCRLVFVVSHLRTVEPA